MKVKTSYLIYGLVALVLLGNGDRIAGTAHNGAVTSDVKASAASTRNQMKQSAREAQKDSTVALDRAKAGCIRIYEDDGNTKEGYFNEGETVGDPANPAQPIQSGFICNSLGLTGEIVDGKIVDLVMISPGDRAEYIGYLAMQRGEF